MKLKASTANKTEGYVDYDEDEEQNYNNEPDTGKIKKSHLSPYEHSLLKKLHEFAKQIEIEEYKENKKLKELKFENIAPQEYKENENDDEEHFDPLEENNLDYVLKSTIKKHEKFKS